MIITHCARKKDFNHTSWSEIKSFYEICSYNRLMDNLEMKDFTELSHTAYISDLTIFAAGDQMNQTIIDLANDCKNLYIVAQDPNWPTSLRQINRSFHLITPFEILDKKPLEEVKKILSETIPTLKLDHCISHSFVRFGDMLVYNDEYLSKYTSELRKFKHLPIDRSVYVGSLKKDRVASLVEYIKKTGNLDFYGNFTKQDFVKVSGINQDLLSTCRFMGRTDNPYVVARLYRDYANVLFAPDDKISFLKTSYIRYAEMCLSNSRIVNLSNRKDVSDVVKSLSDSSGKLSWSRFTQEALKYNLLTQIKNAYEAIR